MQKNFMGKAGFRWFVGVVEDRNDPKYLGRCRVRCLGLHTDNLEKLPTADLPWAHPMNPITSATISGVGQTPLGPVEGTWVVGFFSDGGEAQTPIIMGTLPGVPSTLSADSMKENDDGTSSQTKGFLDPNGNYPKYTETDVNRLAVNDTDNPHPTLTLRKADRDLAVGVANVDATEVVDDQIAADDGGQWNEPETSYNAKYPFNHVYETEGGHIREYDDTVGAKRIHERHSSGSGYEIGDDGTKITRVKKDNYTIVSADDYVHIQGDSKETYDKGLRVKVNASAESGNNYNIEVGAKANVTIEVQDGDINLISQLGDVNLKAGKNMNIDVAQALNIKVGGAITETSDSKTESATNTHQMNARLQDINGNRIDLNQCVKN